jgi:hypothetical protein
VPLCGNAGAAEAVGCAAASERKQPPGGDSARAPMSVLLPFEAVAQTMAWLDFLYVCDKVTILG